MEEYDAANKEELLHKLHFLETLLDELPLPIFAKSANARFCFFNKAYEDFFNVDRRALLGKTVLDLDYLKPEMREQFQREDLRAIQEGKEVHYSIAFDTCKGHRHALYWSKGVSVPFTGKKGLVGTLADITLQKDLAEALTVKIRELRNTQKELIRLSHTDPLTGLLNIRAFEKHALKWTSFADRYGHPLSLLAFDLDHFKRINDRFGHGVGDRLLKTFGEILQKECRKEDLAARVGGDEFAMLLPMTNQEKAMALADRIGDRIHESCPLPDGRKITCSSGVARYSPHEEWACFLRRADMALYRAKEEGRDRTCLYRDWSRGAEIGPRAAAPCPKRAQPENRGERAGMPQ